MPIRRLVVWCPDWPVVAATADAGLVTLTPAAVFHSNRVMACSETARAEGVRRGMRRREAQGRCPELVVHEHDPDRDARLFEPVAVAVEALAPGVEIVRPGLVAVPARGPAGYFGSETGAAERIVDEVSSVGVECQTGIADGLFAAVLAARRGMIVDPGRSRDFLAPLLIEEIDQRANQASPDRAGLVDLLRRLGIRKLGDYAALSASDVATRFGADALLAHRAAGGLEERPPHRRAVPHDLRVTEDIDPPIERVDAAAFVAKTLAQRLHTQLGELGLACTRLGISISTEHGEELHRVWRCAEPLTPSGTADRVRWQLDGWLHGDKNKLHGDKQHGGKNEQRPTAGVNRLSLIPEEVVGSGSLQLDLIDASTEADARASRALVRVQGMLGPEEVVLGVLGGGRSERDRVRLVPWGDERSPALDPAPPWPGRIPAPSPSVVPDSPWPAEVLGDDGQPVEITERHRLTAAPGRVVVGGRAGSVSAWGGPWPVAHRWWTGQAETTQAETTKAGTARMQIVLAADKEEGEVALLLTYEQDLWWVQGVYR